MTSVHCSGFVLTLGRSKRSKQVLSLLLGITDPVCCLFIGFGRKFLMKVLRNDPNAEVRMPLGPELVELKASIRNKYSMLEILFCAAGEMKIHLDQSVDCVI